MTIKRILRIKVKIQQRKNQIKRKKNLRKIFYLLTTMKTNKFNLVEINFKKFSLRELFEKNLKFFTA